MIPKRAGPRLDHWGSLASLVAGVLWLLVWLHQREAHGTTQVNEERVVLGLTWLDSAKSWSRRWSSSCLPSSSCIAAGAIPAVGAVPASW